MVNANDPNETKTWFFKTIYMLAKNVAYRFHTKCFVLTAVPYEETGLCEIIQQSPNQQKIQRKPPEIQNQAITSDHGLFPLCFAKF